MSNVLALPLASVTIVTGNNEDWVDSILFLIDTVDVTGPQLDLRGIAFEMEIRRAAPDHEVILTASTVNGKLLIGTAPDVGFLIINVPLADMRIKEPGEYVGDIVASDDVNTRRCIDISLTIIEGITR